MNRENTRSISYVKSGKNISCFVIIVSQLRWMARCYSRGFYIKLHYNYLEQNEKTGKSKENEMALFLRGFKQCVHDATKFFQDVEELDVSEGRCFRLIQHLKRQIIRYENKEKDLVNVGKKERLVWDSSESSDVSNRRHCEGKLQLFHALV